MGMAFPRMKWGNGLRTAVCLPVKGGGGWRRTLFLLYFGRGMGVGPQGSMYEN